jgi:hypothetical protein
MVVAADPGGTMALVEAKTVPRRIVAGPRFFRWAVLVGIALVGVAAAWLVLDGDDGTLRLDDVAEGVSAHELAGEDVFIVREGNSVRVFLSDARHLPEDTLWWCPSEQIFVEVEHGSMFDRQGRRIGGPAQGGLNQYEARVDHGKLIINRDQVILGGLTPRGESPAAVEGPDFSRPYNSGAGSFCEDPIASPPGNDADRRS